MLWHKGRCADLIVEEVFDKKVAVPDLLVIGLIVVYRSFLPSFNLPFVFCLYAFMCISSFPVFFVYLCLFSTASSFSILHLGSPITSLYSLHTPLSIFYSVYFTPLLPPSLCLPLSSPRQVFEPGQHQLQHVGRAGRRPQETSASQLAAQRQEAVRRRSDGQKGEAVPV